MIGPVRYSPFFSLVLAALIAPCVSAQQVDTDKLIVGTRDVPPFSMQNEGGEWEGIAIDLWEQIAAEIGRTSEYRDMELDALLSGLSSGDIDVGVAAITITAERESHMDFTHSYFTSGLGVAIVPERGGILVPLLQRLFSLEFLQALIALSIVLLIAGLLVWMFERRRNADQFGGGTAQGLGSGFWWAAVTMTTVGYGDKAPRTLGGRLVGLVWMFASIIIISSFTAAIATALTVGSLSTSISGPEDLPGKRVGTVGGSTSETFLVARDLNPRQFETVEDALGALAEGDLDAVVYDAPIMRYFAKTELDSRVVVLPREFEQQDYGIALPEGSPLREEINRVILVRTEENWWQMTIQEYLGAN